MIGGIEMENGAAGSGEQPRKRRKASHGKAERLLLLKLAGAARRARAIHAHLHGVGTTGAPDAADVILATLEQGHPLLTSQLTIGSTEFEEVDPTSLFSPESGVERVDHIVLDNVQRLHGDAVPTALAACTATDEDVAHWGGPFSAELRALTLGDHVPRIKVMRCIDPSVNPVALFTPPGEEPLTAVAASEIEAGAPIAFYGGELVLDSDASASSTYMYEISRAQLDARGYPESLPALRVDGSARGSLARFINDRWAPPGFPKRRPNAYMDTIFDLEARQFRLCFFASRAISRGTEIIADYGPDYWRVALKLLLRAHESAATIAWQRCEALGILPPPGALAAATDGAALDALDTAAADHDQSCQ